MGSADGTIVGEHITQVVVDSSSNRSRSTHVNVHRRLKIKRGNFFVGENLVVATETFREDTIAFPR